METAKYSAVPISPKLAEAVQVSAIFLVDPVPSVLRVVLVEAYALRSTEGTEYLCTEYRVLLLRSKISSVDGSAVASNLDSKGALYFHA